MTTAEPPLYLFALLVEDFELLTEADFFGDGYDDDDGDGDGYGDGFRFGNGVGDGTGYGHGDILGGGGTD